MRVDFVQRNATSTIFTSLSLQVLNSRLLLAIIGEQKSNLRFFFFLELSNLSYIFKLKLITTYYL